MSDETYKIHDPFLNQTAEVSSNLTDRLRGRYACGPTMPNGEPEFGWREYPTPSIQKEAAAEIERLRKLETHVKAWVEIQSRVNTANLYNAAVLHFGLTPVIPD